MGKLQHFFSTIWRSWQIRRCCCHKQVLPSSTPESIFSDFWSEYNVSGGWVVVFLSVLCTQRPHSPIRVGLCILQYQEPCPSRKQRLHKIRKMTWLIQSSHWRPAVHGDVQYIMWFNWETKLCFYSNCSQILYNMLRFTVHVLLGLLNLTRCGFKLWLLLHFT